MPTVFQSGNDELKTLLGDPTTSTLRAYFDARVSEWSAPTKDMGVFTVGIFYDLAQSITGSDAFKLLDAAAVWTLNEMTEAQSMRYVDLLADLAQSSNTTEMPTNLKKHWKSIIDSAKMTDADSVALESLRSHYRDVG